MKCLCLQSDVQSRYTAKNVQACLLCLYNTATLVIDLSHFEFKSKHILYLLLTNYILFI